MIGIYTTSVRFGSVRFRQCQHICLRCLISKYRLHFSIALHIPRPGAVVSCSKFWYDFISTMLHPVISAVTVSKYRENLRAGPNGYYWVPECRIRRERWTRNVTGWHSVNWGFTGRTLRSNCWSGRFRALCYMYICHIIYILRVALYIYMYIYTYLLHRIYIKRRFIYIYLYII